MHHSREDGQGHRGARRAGQTRRDDGGAAKVREAIITGGVDDVVRVWDHFDGELKLNGRELRKLSTNRNG